MSNSTRGPQREAGAPFVMHLERVCRLIAMGQRFVVEINPNSDLPEGIAGQVICGVELKIMEGGEMTMTVGDGSLVLHLGLTLADYKRHWRCWQGGLPTVARRLALRWG